jgi:hypothetical protein
VTRVGSLVKKIFGVFGRRAAPQIYLSVFGKHKGWDDHIDDIGLDTDLLAGIKRQIYIEGIAGNVDAGSWEKLEEENHALPFKHVFAWQQGEHVVVGRLWNSTDGKGRSRFPMIVCAQIDSMPLHWAVEQILPKLEQIEEECRASDTALDVRQLIQKHHEAFHALLAQSAAASDGHERSPTPLNWLATRPAMGENYSGMLTILYQINRELAEYRDADSLSQRENDALSGLAPPPPQPLRVPACTTDPGEALQIWMDFIRQQLNSAVAILALHPIDHDWVDLIVGEPTESQLYCMRAAHSVISFTTEIPYTLAPEFIEQATRAIQANEKPEAALSA